MATPQEPRWLGQEEEQAWLTLVSVLLTLSAALDAQLQRDAGMTFYEYTVLARLSNDPNHSARMSDLAVLTNGSLPRLSQVVTKLEQRGLVRRRKDASDARCTFVVLTNLGLKSLERAAPAHVRSVRRLVFDPLTPTQVRQLRNVHRHIKAAIAADSAVL